MLSSSNKLGQVGTSAPVAPAKPVTSLITTMVPGCCGLKLIRTLGCLGKEDALSKKHAEAFDELVKPGTAMEGQWNTYGKAPDTIAIITTSSRYHINDPEQKEFNRQKKFLEDKGWKLLASWKSYESGGTNFMYGSPGVTPAK